MKKSTELMRIKSLINADRIKSSDVFLELLTKDLKRLFVDYFDFTGNPVVIISKDKGNFSVSINLFADRIKAFGVLPK